MLWGNRPWKSSWLCSVHHHTPPCHITSVHINTITNTHHDLTMWSKATSSQVSTFSSPCRLIDHCWHIGNWAGIDKCIRKGLWGLDTVEKLRANTTCHHIRSNGSLKVRFLSIFYWGSFFSNQILFLKCCSLPSYSLWLFHWNFKMSKIYLYYWRLFISIKGFKQFPWNSGITTRKCTVYYVKALADMSTFPFKKMSKFPFKKMSKFLFKKMSIFPFKNKQYL